MRQDRPDPCTPHVDGRTLRTAVKPKIDKRVIGRTGIRLVKMSNEVRELRKKLMCHTSMFAEANSLNVVEGLLREIGLAVDQKFGNGWPIG